MINAFIVSSGGGAWGIKEAAALDEIRPHINILGVGGASAGSANGGGECLGLGHKLTKLWYEMLTSGKLEDFKLWGPLKFGGALMGPGYGMMRGKEIRSVLTKEFGGACMGDVIKPLRIKVSNLSLRRAETVDSTLEKYKHVKVVDAVMCSLAVPFVIDAQQLVPSSPVLFSDGGIADNVPVSVWDDHPEVLTIVLRFSNSEKPKKVDSLRAMAGAVMDIVRDAAEDEVSRKASHKVANIILDSDGDALDFSQTKEKCDQMRTSGALSAKMWIANPRDIAGNPISLA